MVFNNTLSWLEYSLIGAFILFYFIFVFKIIYVSIRLKTGFRHIFLKVVLRTIYFSLFVISLLAPSFGDIKKEIKAVGKDIYIAVDLSQSMNAVDIQPNRLERLKFELKKLANALQSDRLGIIIFSSQAYMQCPITYDQSALGLFIETLTSGLVPASSTDFYYPLKMALERHLDPENSTASKKAKIVILISDGEDFSEETDDIISEFKANRIKLFTLGIGTAEGGKIPVNGSYKRDSEGKFVVTKLASNTMKNYAQKTGGKYFEISNSINEMPKLIDTISKIEGEVKATKTIDISANKYYYFLFIAFILMALDMLITVRVIRL